MAKKQKLKFSRIEITDLLVAWIVIAIAFANITVEPPFSFGNAFLLKYLKAFLISALTVGLAFLLHELAHKFVAQRYGCWAEFRANFQMLLFAIVISFLGVVFVAPGAVMIKGNVNKDKYGKISIAGIVVNLILAVLFLLLYFTHVGLLKEIALTGMLINSWIAIFNLLPFWMFDGKKVWNWNKFYYILAVIIAIGFMFLHFFLAKPASV